MEGVTPPQQFCKTYVQGFGYVLTVGPYEEWLRAYEAIPVGERQRTGLGPPQWVEAPAQRYQRYANRHLKTAWRSGRAVYSHAFQEAWEETSKDLSLPELEARRAYDRIFRQRRPTNKEWRRVLRQGLPLIGEILSPLHYMLDHRPTKRDKRIYEAFGLGGELAKFINTKEGARFLRAIQKFDKRGAFPVLPPPMGVKEDPVWQARYSESCLFRLREMRLKRCAFHGGHWFLAPDYHYRRYCPAHSLGSDHTAASRLLEEIIVQRGCRL